MTAVTIRNTRDGEDPPTPPMHDDGRLYRLQMHYSGGSRIAYADTPDELCAVLIDDYDWGGAAAGPYQRLLLRGIDPDVPAADVPYPDATDPAVSAALDQALAGASEEMREEMHAAARLAAANANSTVLQAQVLATADPADLSALDEWEQSILTARREAPLDLGGRPWVSPIPLVLADGFYQPHGTLPRPWSGIADVTDPPNLFFIRSSSPLEWLRSLHRAGYVDLAEAKASVFEDEHVDPDPHQH